MKNTFSLKISWCVVLFFLSVVLFGQEHSLNFQVKQGVTGFEIKKDDYSRFEKIPGGDFSIGLDYQFSFFPKGYFIGSVGILWNYNSFARKSISSRSNLISTNAEFFRYKGYERTYRFQSHSIIFPVRVKTQIRKFGFSFGLVPRYHLSNKLFFEEIREIKNTAFEYDLLTIIYDAGETISDVLLNQGRGTQVSLKDKVDMQLVFGLDFQLNERVYIQLEYRKLIHNNYLEVRSNAQSLHWKGVFTNDYEFSLPTISLGINYRIF